MLTCGLVILNYVDYETTLSLISHIKHCSEIDHIVIVDNASPNDSYVRLKVCENEKISVIQSRRNGGYAFGNNVGVRYLIENYNPDIIGIANPDVLFDNAFVRKIKNVFEAYPEYAVLTGLQLSADGKINYGAFHGKDSVSSIFRYEISQLFSLFTRILQKIFHVQLMTGFKKYMDMKLQDGGEVIPVWEVHGSLFFVRASDFKEAGFFDEGTFMYREEEILSSKIERLGKKEGVIPEIKFVHLCIHHFSNNPYNILPHLKSEYYYKNSKIYYFNKYITDSKFLQAVNACFAWLNMVNKSAQAVIFTVRKLVKNMFGVKPRT